MKINYKFRLLSAIVILLMAGVLNAQRTVDVPTGAILSDIILQDTTADGERVDDNTVYVLERGGIYEVAKTLTLDVPLQIKTADGEGDIALIVLKANSEGNYPGSLIRNNSDIYLENVYVSNFSGVGNQPKWGGVRSQGENSTITFKGCYIEWDKASAIQVRANGQTIIFEDCRVAKMGDHMNRNGNGRLVDAREFDIHKVVVQNSTLYHLADRILRNMQAGKIDTFIFDHNTGAQIQGFHGLFHLGHVKYAQITNNLILNPKYMGNHTNISEQTGPSPDNENHYLVTADTIYDNTEFVIHNNNFVYEQKVIDFFNSFDTVSKPQVLAPIVANAMGDAASEVAFEELVSFVNMPELNETYMQELFSDPLKKPTEENFPDEIGIFNIDASYADTYNSYTAAEKGYPLGDLNWFPGLKAQWVEGVDLNAVNIEHPIFGNEMLYNSPNPFSDYTNICYSLKKDASVRLSIFDACGKQICLLVNNRQSAGSYKISWNGNSDNGVILESGIYFYRLEAGSSIITKKMLLVR